MLRIKKLLAYISLLAILPGLPYSNDLTVQKTSKIVPDKGSIEYTIKLFKKSMEAYKGDPILTDRFSRYTQLASLGKTPSAYYVNHQRHEGYPFFSEFNEVSALEWKMQSSQRFRYPQAYFISRNDGGVRFRDDLLHLPEITVAWKNNYTYGAIVPSVEVVEGQQMLFSATMDGYIKALRSITGNQLWEFKLPVGEYIEQPMATFQHQNRVLLTAVSNKGELYILLAATGALVKKIALRHAVTAPLYIVEHENHFYLIVVTSRALMSIHLLSHRIVWQRENQGNVTQSPFSLQIGSIKQIFTASEEGIITAIDLEGNTLWQRSMNDLLPFGASGFVHSAVAYLAGAGASGSAFLLNAVNGNVLARQVLPGKPLTSMSIYPSALSFGVACVDPLSEGKSIFFTSEFFPGRRLPGRVSLPGQRFLGPVGARMEGESWYYLVDAQWRLWMFQHGSLRPLQGYPYPLTFTQGSWYPHLEGGILLTEYALFAACPGKGLFAIGMPEALAVDRSFVSLNAQQLMHSSYRNDMDQMPTSDIQQIIPANFSFPDHERPFTEPAVFFHRGKRVSYIVQANSDGDLNFYDQDGNIPIQLLLNAGPVNIPPLFEYKGEQEVRIYLLGVQGLQAWSWNPFAHKVEKIWERTDLRSSGSTFMQAELHQGKRLFFVDDRRHLTSVCPETGETFFRELVDAWQFAYYVIYAQPLIFCGSKKIDAVNGAVLSRSFILGSHSSVTGIAGRVYLFQSDDLNMIAFDAYKHEVIWRVRKLWCRQYCFQRTAPAVLHKGYHAWVYWPDYQRMLCIDVLRGYIMWRETLVDDFFLSAPAIAENSYEPIVFAGTIKGRVFAWNAHSKLYLQDFPLELPGRISQREELKGCSIPLLLNGSLLIYRRETGLIQLGKIIENSRAFDSIRFEVIPKEEHQQRKYFNRAEVEWDRKIFFSNITQN